ncbi:MAG: hypothetical protein QHH15_00590 [Candidatus Thermoplasmatota archaeon]|nr:hypothetical protein [Candidatus Thermoplasmatota archaeon]
MVYIDLENLEEMFKILEASVNVVEGLQPDDEHPGGEIEIQPMVFVTSLNETTDTGVTFFSVLVTTLLFDPLAKVRDIVRYVIPMGSLRVPPESLKADPDTNVVYEKMRDAADKLNLEIEAKKSELIDLFSSKGYPVYRGVLHESQV